MNAKIPRMIVKQDISVVKKGGNKVLKCGHSKFFQFLRATAVPAGTAVARISYGDSVRLPVRPSGVSRSGAEPSPGEIETDPGLHHMIAQSL